MFKEIFKEMFHPSKAAIIASLKRSDGLPVSEVAKEVQMSYMGVKQHCINLEKQGFVESWRVPRKEVGRPEKLYRLTDKCDELFPVAGVNLTLNLLESTKELFGADAPAKLIEKHFDEQKSAWAPVLDSLSTLTAKAEKLAELREEQGYFNVFTADSDSISIKEYHNPLTPVFDQYPELKEYELQTLEALLGVSIKRDIVEGPHGQKQVLFDINAQAA